MPVNPTAKNPSVVPKGRVVSRGQIDPTLLSLPTWVHPQVAFWYSTWQLIRDCVAGEKQIKEASTWYLPRREGQSDESYCAYINRATFYNFTGRTIGALGGSIFRRQPVEEGLPDRLTERLSTITKDGGSLVTFCAFACEEIFQTNHFGVLIDLPRGESTDPQPYIASYAAEHILDWDVGKHPVTGRDRLTRVVLREAVEQRTSTADPRRMFAIYRELVLEDGVYSQRVYRAVDRDAELKPADLAETIVPTRRGETLDFIPFRVFGPYLKVIGIDKPPMEDIARLNVSHFRSYALLEHSRFFVGSPVYWKEGQGDEEEPFRLGAEEVLVLEPGKKMGLTEMNGQGLKFLVDALDQKESQAASLGGRMIGIRGTSVSESNNQVKISERNEQSLLLRVARSLDEGFTDVLRWWAWWSGVAKEDLAAIEITFNKDFLFDQAGAREFRAIHAMYKAGIITIDIVYEFLKRFNVIPDWMKLEEFKGAFSKLSSFPGDPDAIARAKGYPDAKTMHQVEQQEEDRDHEIELQESEQEAEAARAKEAAKAAADRPNPESARGAFGRNQ